MLTDYGKLHVSANAYTVLRPDSLDSAVQGWRGALASGTALRIRGSGHGLPTMKTGRTAHLERSNIPFERRRIVLSRSTAPGVFSSLDRFVEFRTPSDFIALVTNRTSGAVSRTSPALRVRRASALQP